LAADISKFLALAVYCQNFWPFAIHAAGQSGAASAPFPLATKGWQLLPLPAKKQILEIFEN
jgi:hypothetical protein